LFKLTDLNQVVENVKTDLELLINQKKATISADPLPVIEAIPVQMNQLFYNLLNNALKFSSPERQSIIRIFVSKTDGEDILNQYVDKTLDYFEITIQDNGIGFEQEYAERIFVMFQQLHTKQMYGGTGIGLAICKKIAENHKGQIRAYSQQGEGAVFKIILPQSQPVSEKTYTYIAARNLA
jgi:two-component system CheB/CheR fusion protein